MIRNHKSKFKTFYHWVNLYNKNSLKKKLNILLINSEICQFIMKFLFSFALISILGLFHKGKKIWWKICIGKIFSEIKYMYQLNFSKYIAMLPLRIARFFEWLLVFWHKWRNYRMSRWCKWMWNLEFHGKVDTYIAATLFKILVCDVNPLFSWPFFTQKHLMNTFFIFSFSEIIERHNIV